MKVNLKDIPLILQKTMTAKYKRVQRAAGA